MGFISGKCKILSKLVQPLLIVYSISEGCGLAGMFAC